MLTDTEILKYARQGVISEMRKLIVKPTEKNVKKYRISIDENNDKLAGIITDKTKFMDLYKKQDWLQHQMD